MGMPRAQLRKAFGESVAWQSSLLLFDAYDKEKLVLMGLFGLVPWPSPVKPGSRKVAFGHQEVIEPHSDKFYREFALARCS